MRTILITLILVGVIKGLSGTEINAAKSNEITYSDSFIRPTLSTEPQFAELGGSLFLAIETQEDLVLDDGAVIEFKFKGEALKSFHVNDVNQDVLDQGDADVLVMIHKDLALALKSKRLKEIIITDGDEVTTYEVGEFWQPHNYLTSL
jgi:hypothetical protein